MATQLRETPESQEFVDREALPGWRVTIRLGRNRAGAWVISRLVVELEPKTTRQLFQVDVERRGITTRMLRELSFSALHAYAARVMAADCYTPPAKRLKPADHERKRGRPPQYSAAWYRNLAGEYLKLAARGVPDVDKHLSRTYKRPDGTLLSHAGMRSAIRRTRMMGLLGPATQGRASAIPPSKRR